MRRWLPVLCLVLVAACSDGAADPPSWVAPYDDGVVPRGDAIELAVATTDASVVRFSIDGTEVGVCDPAQPDEDCQHDDVWRWTVVFDQVGLHDVTAIIVQGDGTELALVRTIEVAPETDARFLDLEDDAVATSMTGDVTTIAAASRGYLDPAHGYHSVFGGIAWAVSSQYVVLHSGKPIGSVSAVRTCMNRYGASIRKWADHYKLSRASVIATALTESNCTNPAGSSDGLSSGPMQVTASTCSAITGLSRSTCHVRMHTQPDFSFQVGVRYMSSTYQRNQHHRDPPKIAAAYNAGSLRRSSANRWHLVSTGNHIDRYVSWYNAYRRWEGP